MVKLFIGVFISSALLLCYACVIVPLDPERPEIISMDPGKESVQLFVAIERGIDEEDGTPLRGDKNFAVYVDGEPRAWIAETESYTLIRVTRRSHVVKIDKPYRGVFFFFGVPLPNPGGVSTEELTINCWAEEICGVLVHPNAKKAGGLVLRILPVSPDQIFRLMEILSFVETG